MIGVHLIGSIIIIPGRSGRLAGPRAAISGIVWVDLVAAVIFAGFILRQHVALSGLPDASSRRNTAGAHILLVHEVCMRIYVRTVYIWF